MGYGNFTQLGSIIDKQEGSDADVKTLISRVRAAFPKLIIWNSKQLPPNTKVGILKTNIETVLLYELKPGEIQKSSFKEYR